MPYGFTESARVKGGAPRFSLALKSLIDRPVQEAYSPMEFPSQANDPLGSRICAAFRVLAREA